MTSSPEISALNKAVKEYSHAWVEMYRAIRKVDLRTASADEVATLRKECNRTELYARAVSDHLHSFIVSLEGA